MVGGTDGVVDVRWARLFAEHERQVAARAAAEDERLGELRLTQRLVATLGVGGVLLAAVIALLLTVTAGWYGIERWTRLDPSRCAPGLGATRVQVSLGWLEPDTCSYYDEQGELILSGGGSYAGPVTRSYGDAAEGVLATGVAGAMVLVSASALVRTGPLSSRRGRVC
jgi:hypothetical protein